jgi:hypothetical protein
LVMAVKGLLEAALKTGGKAVSDAIEKAKYDRSEFDPRFYPGKKVRVKDFPEKRPDVIDTNTMVPYQRLALQDLVGRPYLTTMSDRIAAGGILEGIGNKPLAHPLRLTGGQDYMRENPGKVWASAEKVVPDMEKAANELKAEFGQSPVFLPWRMTPSGGDFAHLTGQTMLSWAAANMPKGVKKQLDKDMKQLIPDWAGVDDPKSLMQYGNLKDTQRKAVMNMMDVKYRNQGGISRTQARLAVADQSQLLSPVSGFQNVGEIDLSRGTLAGQGNPTYPFALAGEYKGTLDTDVTAMDLNPQRYARKRKKDGAFDSGPQGPDYLSTREAPRRAMEVGYWGGLIDEPLLKSLSEKGFKVDSPAAVGLLSGAGALAALAPQEAEAGAAGLLNKIRAYHGSPHDFDRFSTESIGTGEGAQQYGHGLYFAEREGTAQSYRDSLRHLNSDPKIALKEAQINETFSGESLRSFTAALSDANDKSPSQIADNIQMMSREFRSIPKEKITDAVSRYQDKVRGRMYEVGIDARPEELLDFDAPLSEQSEQVQNAFGFKPAPMPNFTADDVKKTLSDNPAYRYAVEGFPAAETVEKALSQANKPVLQNTGPLGADAYNKLARELADETSDLTGAKSASEALRQSGVKGIKYADAQTRFSPKGRTSNYVIFDDATVDIARKYGVSMPVAAGLLSGGLGTEQAQAAEYREAPVVQEQSFGDMVNEYANINQRAQAAEAQKFDALMREDARLRDMGSAAFGQVSPELAAYRRSQMLPTIGEIGMGALEGAVDTVDFVSQLPTAISTMTMPKRTPLRDRLGGLLDYSFVDERDQRTRDEARLIGGLLSPI